jgi:hypothetical protein
MESMPRISDPPTAAEGCRDINRLPITMEHPTVACQEGRRRRLLARPDLQTVNNTIITLHPVVPNSYILLSLLPPQASWLTCLDLKDAFFCLRLAWHRLLSPCLPLNGKTPILEKKRK